MIKKPASPPVEGLDAPAQAEPTQRATVEANQTSPHSDEPSDFVPAVRGETSTVSTNIQAFMDSYNDGMYYVPDYQRASSQWNISKRSLFIESLINNITIPPLIVYPAAPDKNEIVDGQQRITTIRDFLQNDFALAPEKEAEYRDNVGPIVQDKTFDELPEAIQKRIKRYVLNIIKLPANLELGLRLEIFRRINEGGEPLSPQDLRLAVFGQSERVYLIRLAGVCDRDQEGFHRMIRAGKEKYKLDDPWKEDDKWKLWWNDAIGQAPSQMFLYYVVCRDLSNLEQLLKSETQRSLGVKYEGTTVSVLDIYLAQLQYEDQHPTRAARMLANLNVLQNWFAEFELWFNEIKMAKVPHISPNSATKVALFIAGAIRVWGTPDKVRENQWEAVQVLLTKGPRQIKEAIEVEYPITKGKWPGQKAQIDAMVTICRKIAQM